MTNTSCHRCGDTTFPVQRIVEGIDLCRDCVRWIGQGSLMSLTGESLGWKTTQSVDDLKPIFAACYDRAVVLKATDRKAALKRRDREDARHGRGFRALDPSIYTQGRRKGHAKA